MGDVAALPDNGFAGGQASFAEGLQRPILLKERKFLAQGILPRWISGHTTKLV